MRCQISEDDLPAFVAYLALGTLEAIRTGTVSPDGWYLDAGDATDMGAT